MEEVHLHIPRSWNELKRGELQILASLHMQPAVFHNETMEQRMIAIKAKFIMDINNLRIVVDDGDAEDKKSSILVERASDGLHFRLPYEVLINVNKERLAWMDGQSTLTKFPFDGFRRLWRKYSPPSVMMNGFSWRQYRIASDFLSLYIVRQNIYIREAAKETLSVRRGKELKDEMNIVRAKFLATIYSPKGGYTLGQEQTHWKDFLTFSDVDFQCVLFWWSGMMTYLQKQFPKVFNHVKTKQQQKENPFIVYTRTTATLQKYLELNEAEVNEQTYTIVLQHMNNMADEYDRMQRIKNK